MTSTATLRRRLGVEFAGPKLEPRERANAAMRRRYSRDPFAHCDDGHVVIEDLETGEIVQLHPTEQQKRLTAEWVDLPYLRRTGKVRFRNVHLRKSRQLGMTWWVAYLVLWLLTWHPVAGLALFPTIGDAADSGFTTDSFLGRVRFMCEYGQADDETVGGFPGHLRPDLSFTGGNDPIVRNRRRQRSFVACEGATASPGRGKRYAYGFLDEFAFHPFARAAHRALSRAIPHGRLYNSTPHGEDNTYAWLLRVRPRGYRFVRFHWSHHPVYGHGKHVAGTLKTCKLCQGNRGGDRWQPNDPTCHRYPGKLTSPWFDQAVIEMTDEDVASELEIDFTASLTARVYPEFDQDWHVADRDIPWFEELHNTTCISFDYGAAVTGSGVICQDAPGEFRVIGEFEVLDSDPDDVARAIVDELRAVGVHEPLLRREWLEKILCVGDPAGNARQQATGRPLVAEYRRHGFVIRSKHSDVASTIRATRRLMLGRPKQLVVSPRCRTFVRHVKHNTWPVTRDGNRDPDATAPKNDEHNHICRSFAYLVAWLFPPPRLDRPPGGANADRRDVGGVHGDPRTGKTDPDIRPDMKL